MWKTLCPKFINDFHGFEETVEAVTKNVVALSRQLELEVEADDVTELLASHGEELTAEDLIELESQMIEEEEDIPTPEPKKFTAKGLAKGFAMIEEGLAVFEGLDPNMERFTWVSRGVMDTLRCYKEIWEEKRKLSFQTSLSQYFKKVERPAPSSDPVPSTSAPSAASPAPSAASPAAPPVPSPASSSSSSQ